MDRFVDIVEDKIDLDSISKVWKLESGAINTFVGTVRNETQGKKVIKLHYEAYPSMAMKEMSKLIDKAAERWKLNGALIIHRVGDLYPGDAAVFIAVSTSHRADSFAACQFIIDTLKETVPIWKKEFFEDGEVWVAAHP